jgi:hypothetical protein
VRILQYIGTRGRVENTLRAGSVPSDGEVCTPDLVIQSRLMGPFPEFIDMTRYKRLFPKVRYSDTYWHRLDDGRAVAVSLDQGELAVMLAALEYCMKDPIAGTDPVLNLFERLKLIRSTSFPSTPTT